MPIRVFLRDGPQRAIALATDTHVLIFRHSPSTAVTSTTRGSTTSVNEGGAPRCIVEFSPWEGQDMQGYRALTSMTPGGRSVHGTLGLVTIDHDVFLCVVNGSSRVATVRPGETIQRIQSVEFHCLNRSDYDHLLNDQVNPFPTDQLDPDGYDHNSHRDALAAQEHPCLALKKLLSGGSFYYSTDFDLTKRLQDRPTDSSATVAIDSLDAGFLWNTYMIQPLVDFRSRLSTRERTALDQSRILTSAIRGFAATVTVPPASSPARSSRTAGLPSTMTLISRLSCRRAGTRFNARGIDDDGNVANFVETETIFCTDTLCFSYVQCRGSIPIFWEQASGLPGQQKITITRSVEAAQPAFDRHFENLAETYGDIFVVNLLSEEKPNEVQLTRQYMYHIEHSSLNHHSAEKGESAAEEHKHLSHLNYDFHAETRGPNGYEAASGIRRYIERAALSFDFLLTEEIQETVQKDGKQHSITGQNDVLRQSGIFRTNCLDCLDRTNLVQTIISQIAFEIFLAQQGENRPTSDFWARHGMLWADNGDALSKIYAGTGALKSSFTRSGKMSLAGALADLRKSTHRLYINNFEDKGRQTTMDMLLGRQIGQTPVHLFDPINDWVTSELSKRSAEFTTAENINIWVGTFNLNGKTGGGEDLSCWLCPTVVEPKRRVPEIVAVGFQEIVQLDVQQIMSTDPHRRQQWEALVKRTLNANAQKHAGEDYVLLRGGQLVGASLSVFVRASALPYIKNVEGAVKKTGMSGMAGNKGAVAIRMDYADTSICIVTAHLAAGFGNYDERNQDYRTIASGLRFQRNRSIEDHTTVIWAGDFNYRIGMDNDRARQLIKKRDLSQLYENDQLNLQMVHGKCFPYYSEQTPTFNPTYKFNVGTDEYDTSEKNRIPAWCDRILTRGNNLRQLHYDSAPLRFSDHRPVWGLFECGINVIDQARKEQISQQLYTKRRAVVGAHTAGQGTADSDDESLYGYESIEPGLPPASSDKRKWWLDNGMPARSTVQAPPGQVLNPARPSNPFRLPSNEPEWIRIEKPTGNTPPSFSPNQTGTAGPTRDLSIRRKPLIPDPSNGVQEQPPPQPARPRPQNGSVGNNNNVPYSDDPNPLARRGTQPKSPPPKPNKPELLRSESQKSSSPAPSSTRSMGPPPPPEPRRSGTQRNQATTAAAAQPYSDFAPALPPRAPTGLMDEDSHGGQEMAGWKPLVPQ